MSEAGQTAGRSTIDTSVSAVRRWTVLKTAFSFLSFWSAMLALVCGTVEEWQGHTRFFHDEATEPSLCLVQERPVGEREHGVPTGAGALFKGEGLTGGVPKAGGSIQNTEGHV